MQINPGEDWHSLTENYRAMLDGELEELAASFGDLTETAQQVLRNELRNRGLAEPGAAVVAPNRRDAPAGLRWAISVDPNASAGESSDTERDGESAPRDYTWKTLLCEPETTDQAHQIREMLRRAGIDSWVERPGGGWIFLRPRVVVAADQLEKAIQVARQRIPQDIVDEFRQEVSEYVPPKCPKCGAEDPVLESAEPTNSWLCEACGKQWTEPAIDADGEAEKAEK